MVPPALALRNSHQQQGCGGRGEDIGEPLLVPGEVAPRGVPARLESSARQATTTRRGANRTTYATRRRAYGRTRTGPQRCCAVGRAGAILPRLRLKLLSRSRSWALAVFAAFALSMLAAIWSLPGFLVQDSPLYLYNSHILLEGLRSSSPFDQYLALDWTPLPYWGAYALLMSLMPVLPPRTADQVLITLTSVGVASALMWLRWRIAGWQGAAVVVPLTIVLSINVLWMYGLHNFLLGAILFFLTLACWWRLRERLGAKPAAILAALLIAGYFCHLVSFALTAGGMIVLAIVTPGPNLGRRLKWTALSILPSVPLLIVYSRAMRAGGEAGVHWSNLTNFFSPAAWLTYVFMADVATIHNNGVDVPGGGFTQVLFDLPPPSRWALIGLFLLVMASAIRRSDADKAFDKAHRGWILLAAVLLLGGAFGPDDLGPAHGYMRERVVFLGFATVVPALRVRLNHAFAHAGFGLLLMAAILQTCLFWDYGVKADRLVSEFMKAKPYVGTGNRVAAVMVNTGWEYRTSPVVHVADMLGADNGNLVWNNVGPALYYFPLKYRSREARVLSVWTCNRLHYYDFIDPEKKVVALRDYRAIMERFHGDIDVLVMWSSTPELDAINRTWFEPQPRFEGGRVKVLGRRAQ